MSRPKIVANLQKGPLGTVHSGIASLRLGKVHMWGYHFGPVAPLKQVKQPFWGCRREINKSLAQYPSPVSWHMIFGK